MARKRQSVAEAGVYRVLKGVLTDLQKAERTLATSLENTPPNPERSASLAAIRTTIAKLHLIFASQN
jgi:hypothetical protein